jgi:G3E family GTPase
MRTPATLFTGFLGSGKTTVIMHMLDDLSARGEKCVYIKNEVGDSSTDALLLKSHGNQISGVRELTNGCICCTLTGQMYHAVNELIEKYHPDRIIMESAGTAKPHDLALAVSQHPLLLRDGVICVIDVVNFNGYERIDSLAQKQASFTDILLFNKVELVNEERLQAVVSYVREVNLSAPIIEAPQGHAPIDILCGITSSLVMQPNSREHHHEEDDHIQGITITPSAMSMSQFQEVVNRLPKAVFRVKGVISTPEGKKLVNVVNKRITTLDLSQNAPDCLIVIGYEIGNDKDKIEKLF